MTKTRVSRPKPVVIEAGGREPMAEPTFLQIQGRGESAMRMIEMPLGPVRIGRGPYCEVRLGDPGLGDVQCMLRRRGATWHFQPVGPSGHVWIDGRAADQQRPIPLGVPFRVGEHWLILRPADSATNDWGSFDAPISVDPRPQVEIEPTPVVEASRAEPAEESPRPRPAAPAPTSAPAPGSDDAEERLRRWEARLGQRERWLKDRQEERCWEARWKSAGETIRSKSTPPAARPVTPTRTPTPPPSPSPTLPPASTPRSALRPTQTPPVARIIEPRGAEPIRRAAEPGPRPSAPRVAVRPLPDPPTPIRRPVASPTPARVEARPLAADRPTPPVAAKEKPDAPTSRALVMLAPTPVVAPEPEAGAVESSPPLPAGAGPGVRVVASPIVATEPTQSSSPLPTGAGPGVRVVASPVGWKKGSPAAHPEGDGAEAAVFRRAGLALPTMHDRQGEPCPTEDLLLSQPTGHDPHPGPLPEGEGAGTQAPASEPVASTLIESSTWLDGALPVAIEEARRAEVAAPRPAEPPAPAIAREAGISRAEWPSARTIFEAQARRAGPEPAPLKSPKRKVVEPEPTEALAPPCWSMPLWLGWFPTVVATTLLGLGGIALGCGWAVEASNAGVAIRLATRPEGATASPIDPTLIPRGGWWTSTATHQAAWALALARAGDGEDHSEDVRALLDSARATSRLAARSRFLVEPPDPAEPGSAADLSHLGRSRDVVTLVGTARRLRKEGKVGPAIRAYRSAMEIASKARPEDLDPPGFLDDPQVRRYALPREALVGFAARAMARDGEWTAEQWAEALPPSAAASWVASRVFAGLNRRADADRLADRAILQADSPTPPGHDPAEALAAVAEALAYRKRWTDAAERYSRAIDLAERDTTRRMWWLNLAELAQRTNDDALRVRAIEAAKSPSTVDEVTRRAVKYQQTLPGPVPKS